MDAPPGGAGGSLRAELIKGRCERLCSDKLCGAAKRALRVSPGELSASPLGFRPLSKERAKLTGERCGSSRWVWCRATRDPLFALPGSG